MQDPEKTDPLQALEAQLAKAERIRQERKPTDEADETSGKFMGMAFRIGVELVSAMVVSMGCGWLLDKWLGTKPWLMIVFFFLGAGAGILNVYRAVNNLGLAVGYRRPGEPGPGAIQPKNEGRDGSDH